MAGTSVESLKLELRKFAADRDWDQFHSPKNFAMALIVETAELVEHFQWLTEAESKSLSEQAKEEVAMEMADVLIYLIRLADKLDIDLLDSASTKIRLNELKYPIDKCRGISTKYNQL